MTPTLASPLAALLLLLASSAVLLRATASTALQPISAPARRSALFPPFNPQYCPNTAVRQNIDPKLASNCTGIRLPWVLCRHCRMRPHDDKGNFVNNRDIYNLERWPCRQAMIKYIELNPCDEPRVQQVRLYHRALDGKESEATRKRMRKYLGEFMYNVCELCCDCVPIGLDRDLTVDQQYNKRRNVEIAMKKATKKTDVQLGLGQDTLIHVPRGNCPVHYYYDTCRMWPNLRDIANPWMPLNHNLDNICQDHVYPWWNSTNLYRRNWLANRNATIPSLRFVRFLQKINHVLGCRDRRVWTDCAKLELAQGRV